MGSVSRDETEECVKRECANEAAVVVAPTEADEITSRKFLLHRVPHVVMVKEKPHMKLEATTCPRARKIADLKSIISPSLCAMLGSCVGGG